MTNGFNNEANYTKPIKNQAKHVKKVSIPASAHAYKKGD